MKKFYILFFLILAIFTNAQIVNIPDANFKTKLLSANSANTIASSQTPVYSSNDDTWYIFSYNTIDTNGDGEIQVSEAQAIKWLSVSSSSISNLTGIEAFTNLQVLHCQINQLSSLNVSGLTNLKQLSCQQNQLSSLNVSGCTNLQTFSCYYNLLTSLNVSGLTNLVSLDCSYNQLTSLFIKNVNWALLGFSNNPNLQYICADEEDLSLVQSLINQSGSSSTCHVNNYCSFTPGGTFYTINGNNRFDSNNNGCDSSDGVYRNLKINITNGTQTGSLILNSLGNFTIPVQAGTHTLTPVLENPSYFNISPATTTVSFPAQSSPLEQNFCITPNGVHHDVEATLFPLNPARPGFDASYKIVYKNKGNSVASGAVVFNFDDCHQITDYVTATPTPNAVAYNGLTFNYTNLQPFESREIVVTLNVNSPMETPAVNAGDFLPINANITCTNTDENLINNTFNIRQIVVNSYDPNDKTCLEGPIINPSKIGDYVTYQIRFENTGTFPAQNIVVKDMIDTAKFDVSTLQIINGSHTCYAKITGNKVEFIFENINLPFADATNDGYVVFKIKSLPTLTVNSTVSNSASIYFDYNFPIITNTATSTYQLLNASSFVFENEFVFYPNPVKDKFTIKTKNSLEIKSIEIYNTLGQIVLAIPSFTKNVDVSSLQRGTYLVKVNTETGSSGVKMIKE